MPIQDVTTRWNSTFLMLRRGKRLRSFITQYCAQFNYGDSALDNDQWRQIDYLICLTKPFFDFTLGLSKTREAASHLVFQIYNRLFEHLDKSKTKLQRKMFYGNSRCSSLSKLAMQNYLTTTRRLIKCVGISTRFVRCYRRIDSSSSFLMTGRMPKNSVISIGWPCEMPSLLSRNVLHSASAQGPQGSSSGLIPNSFGI